MKRNSTYSSPSENKKRIAALIATQTAKINIESQRKLDLKRLNEVEFLEKYGTTKTSGFKNDLCKEISLLLKEESKFSDLSDDAKAYLNAIFSNEFSFNKGQIKFIHLLLSYKYIPVLKVDLIKELLAKNEQLLADHNINLYVFLDSFLLKNKYHLSNNRFWEQFFTMICSYEPEKSIAKFPDLTSYLNILKRFIKPKNNAFLKVVGEFGFNEFVLDITYNYHSDLEKFLHFLNSLTALYEVVKLEFIRMFILFKEYLVLDFFAPNYIPLSKYNQINTLFSNLGSVHWDDIFRFFELYGYQIMVKEEHMYKCLPKEKPYKYKIDVSTAELLTDLEIDSDLNISIIRIGNRIFSN